MAVSVSRACCGSPVVRATGRRQEIARGMERAISAADPLLPVASFRSMLDERDSALKSQRVNAWLLGTLAALALSLALVGVYGMVANSVAERTREFGIRIALGSSLRRVVWDAVAPGMLLSATGVAAGGLLAAGSVRVLKGLLYGVPPIDAREKLRHHFAQLRGRPAQHHGLPHFG